MSDFITHDEQNNIHLTVVNLNLKMSLRYPSKKFCFGDEIIFLGDDKYKSLIISFYYYLKHNMSIPKQILLKSSELCCNYRLIGLDCFFKLIKNNLNILAILKLPTNYNIFTKSIPIILAYDSISHQYQIYALKSFKELINHYQHPTTSYNLIDFLQKIPEKNDGHNVSKKGHKVPPLESTCIRTMHKNLHSNQLFESFKQTPSPRPFLSKRKETTLSNPSHQVLKRKTRNNSNDNTHNYSADSLTQQNSGLSQQFNPYLQLPLCGKTPSMFNSLHQHINSLETSLTMSPVIPCPLDMASSSERAFLEGVYFGRQNTHKKPIDNNTCFTFKYLESKNQTTTTSTKICERNALIEELTCPTHYLELIWQQEKDHSDTLLDYETINFNQNQMKKFEMNGPDLQNQYYFLFQRAMQCNDIETLTPPHSLCKIALDKNLRSLLCSEINTEINSSDNTTVEYLDIQFKNGYLSYDVKALGIGLLAILNTKSLDCNSERSLCLDVYLGSDKIYQLSPISTQNNVNPEDFDFKNNENYGKQKWKKQNINEHNEISKIRQFLNNSACLVSRREDHLRIHDSKSNTSMHETTHSEIVDVEMTLSRTGFYIGVRFTNLDKFNLHLFPSLINLLQENQNGIIAFKIPRIDSWHVNTWFEVCHQLYQTKKLQNEIEIINEINHVISQIKFKWLKYEYENISNDPKDSVNYLEDFYGIIHEVLGICEEFSFSNFPNIYDASCEEAKKLKCNSFFGEVFDAYYEILSLRLDTYNPIILPIQLQILISTQNFVDFLLSNQDSDYKPRESLKEYGYIFDHIMESVVWKKLYCPKEFQNNIQSECSEICWEPKNYTNTFNNSDNSITDNMYIVSLLNIIRDTINYKIKQSIPFSPFDNEIVAKCCQEKEKEYERYHIDVSELENIPYSPTKSFAEDWKKKLHDGAQLFTSVSWPFEVKSETKNSLPFYSESCNDSSSLGIISQLMNHSNPRALWLSRREYNERLERNSLNKHLQLRLLRAMPNILSLPWAKGALKIHSRKLDCRSLIVMEPIELSGQVRLMLNISDSTMPLPSQRGGQHKKGLEKMVRIADRPKLLASLLTQFNNLDSSNSNDNNNEQHNDNSSLTEMADNSYFSLFAPESLQLGNGPPSSSEMYLDIYWPYFHNAVSHALEFCPVDELTCSSPQTKIALIEALNNWIFYNVPPLDILSEPLLLKPNALKSTTHLINEREAEKIIRSNLNQIRENHRDLAEYYKTLMVTTTTHSNHFPLSHNQCQTQSRTPFPSCVDNPNTVHNGQHEEIIGEVSSVEENGMEDDLSQENNSLESEDGEHTIPQPNLNSNHMNSSTVVTTPPPNNVIISRTNRPHYGQRQAQRRRVKWLKRKGERWRCEARRIICVSHGGLCLGLGLSANLAYLSPMALKTLITFGDVKPKHTTQLLQMDGDCSFLNTEDILHQLDSPPLNQANNSSAASHGPPNNVQNSDAQNNTQPAHSYGEKDAITFSANFVKIGIILGISASLYKKSLGHKNEHLESANNGIDLETLTRILILHSSAFNQSKGNWENSLKQSLNVESAVLFSLGLLHQQTFNEHFTNIMLREIECFSLQTQLEFYGNKSASNANITQIGQNSYSLCAGLALGSINFGRAWKESKRHSETLTRIQEKLCDCIKLSKNNLSVNDSYFGAMVALALIFFKSNCKTLVKSHLIVGDKLKDVLAIRPDFLMMNMITIWFILYDEIGDPYHFMNIFDSTNDTRNGVEQHLLLCKELLSNESSMDKALASINGNFQDALQIILAYHAIFAGKAFVIALKYCGSHDFAQAQIMMKHIQQIQQQLELFRSLQPTERNSSQRQSTPIWSNNVYYQNLEMCLNAFLISLAVIMAGSCNVKCLDIFRGCLDFCNYKMIHNEKVGPRHKNNQNYTKNETENALHEQDILANLDAHLYGDDVTYDREYGFYYSNLPTYGHYYCVNLCISLLFLGQGRCLLKNTSETCSDSNDISSHFNICLLLSAFYPLKWPNYVSDFRYHLQPLRHFYALCVEHSKPSIFTPKAQKSLLFPDFIEKTISQIKIVGCRGETFLTIVKKRELKILNLLLNYLKEVNKKSNGIGAVLKIKSDIDILSYAIFIWQNHYIVNK